MARSIFRTKIDRVGTKRIEVDLLHASNRYEIVYLVGVTVPKSGCWKRKYQLECEVRREGRKLIITFPIETRYRLGYRILPPLLKWHVRKE